PYAVDWAADSKWSGPGCWQRTQQGARQIPQAAMKTKSSGDHVMTRRIIIFGACLVLSSLASSTASAQYAVQNPSEATVINATNVFAQAMMMQDNQIPRSILANAQAIAIVPSLVRGAFVVGVQYGHGVLVIRDARGAWQAPRMVEVAGGSFGYQI